MKKITLIITLFWAITLSAQVKVGDNPASLNGNSALDIERTDKGLLLRRVALTGTANGAPLSSHVAGMTVYNTAMAGNVTPGYYYNDGTQWVRVASPVAAEWVDGTNNGVDGIFAVDALANGKNVFVIKTLQKQSFN